MRALVAVAVAMVVGLAGCASEWRTGTPDPFYPVARSLLRGSRADPPPDRPESHVGIMEDRFRGLRKAVLQRCYLYVPGPRQYADPLEVQIVGPLDGSEEPLLSLSTSSRGGWRYLKCHTVDVLADGRPAPIGRTKHDGDVADREVRERITARVSRETLIQIARARLVEIRVCADEMEVDPMLSRAVARFLDLAYPGWPPTAD